MKGNLLTELTSQPKHRAVSARAQALFLPSWGFEPPPPCFSLNHHSVSIIRKRGHGRSLRTGCRGRLYTPLRCLLSYRQLRSEPSEVAAWRAGVCPRQPLEGF